MSLSRVNHDELEAMPPAMALSTAVLILLAVIAGAFTAIIVLPVWLPGLSTSLASTEPKAYWYLSRISGLVAYTLLWLSMALGLGITSQLARLWPGGPSAFDLHQFTSLLGLAFALFHALILIGDSYVGYTLAQVLVPFASTGYRPGWVGVGQIGFYLLAVVGLSFYVRQTLGHRAWRLIHSLSFVVFLLALAHGLMSGSDSAAPWVRGLYWASLGSLLFLGSYRLLSPLVVRPRSPSPVMKDRA